MRIILYVFSALFLLSLSSQAQNANWNALNPNLFPTNVSGQIHGISRVSQVKFHPSNANKMYAISARGGLFISNNGGTTWNVTPGTDFMPYARLASICVDFTNDQILYLGTGDHNYYYSGSGVWKTTDGGNTFTQIGLNNMLVIDMIMDPLNNNTIVAVTNQGIYKTNNAGTSWTLKSTMRPFDDLKQKSNTSRVLYACTTDSAFYRSNDFGETWAQITNGIILPPGIFNGNGCRIAVTPADTNIVYLGMVANGGMLYKSTDGGATFNAIKTNASPYLTYYNNAVNSSGQGDYNFAIGVDRINPNIVYCVAHNVWKSTNGGTNWAQLTNWWEKVHTDMHQINTSPYNNNQLWNMNDGGVWLSTDGGNNWTPKSDGLNGYEIYHGNCSPTRRDMMSIGTQDNGELYAANNNWYTNRGGDWGSQCAFDYRPNSSMVYYYESNKRRLVTGGESTYGLPSRVSDIDDIAFYRNTPDLAFVADSFIYRTNNLTATTPTWTQIANLGTVIKAMHVSYGDPNKLYIITNDAKIHVSNNALQASPTFTTYTIPSNTNLNASITSIKSNTNVIYITANTQVYRSANNGATWTNITFNLPSVNHIRILADEFFSSNELVMIASANSVYYKSGFASSWTLFNTNLPTRTDAIDLSIYNDSTSNTILRYACYGRSVWETPIDNLRALKADFSANNTAPCIGATVTFSDQSNGNVSSRLWSFPGGTPNTSIATNPVVQYNTAGIYDVTLTVNSSASSDTKTISQYISTFGSPPPLTEGFEGTSNLPIGWKNIDNNTLGVTWVKTGSAGGFGTSTSSMLFDNYSWNNPSEKDELYVKPIGLAGLQNATLKFDVAYQVFSGYSDSLAILLSTNCGTSFTKIYQKGGTILSTAGSGGNNFVPSATQWRTDSVSLNAYIGQPNVLIAFQNINGYGNKLYLDNVQISGTCVNPNIPTIQTSQNNICLGQSVTLSIATGILNSATQWSWYSGSCGGTWIGNGNSITVTPNSTTTYFARGEGACVNGGNCASITISVNSLPNVTASNVSACIGASVTLIGLPTGGIFTQPNPYNGPSTTYEYTFTDGNGCSNTSSLATITMFSLPILSSNVFPNDSVCTGSNITLVATGANTYTWTNGIQSPTNGIAFIPSSTSTYTVTGTDANGCSNASTLYIQVITPSISANGDSRCGPGAVQLSATSAGVPQWYTVSNGGSAIYSGSNYAPTIATSTNYYVEDNLYIGTTGSNSFVGPVNNAIGAGLQSTLNQYTLFNVAQPCTLVSVVVYPGAAGNAILELRDPSGVIVMQSTSIVISAGQVGTAVTMNLNWPLTVGNGYRLSRGLSGVALYRNSVGAVYPYTSSSISITGNSFNPSYYYWAYNWTVSNLSANYCSSPRIPVNAVVHPLPIVTASNATGCLGINISLLGSPSGGNFSVPNPYNGPSTNFTYVFTDGNGCTNTSAPASISVLPCSTNVAVKVYLQGYYIGNSLMEPVLKNEGIGNSLIQTDSIIFELRESFAPYALVTSSGAMLQTNGIANANFNSLNGNYYLVIKHRNTLPTWSALPINFSSPNVQYDFTNASNKAYGQNMKEMEPSVWAFYTGELNGDENIDLSDFSFWKRISIHLVLDILQPI
jgi:photosystem II stability/assembly factor-like uncharacterized protein